MGDYYMAVNHTRRQRINPHDLDEGAKLGEAQAAKDLLWRLLACGVWQATDLIEVVSDRNDEWYHKLYDEYVQMVPADAE